MNFNTFKRNRFSLLAMLAGSLLVNTGVGCEYRQETPAIERRAQEINSVVMCPVCPGEAIDQSQHPLAVQMRNIVAEELSNGRTEDQIKEYFVDAYGSGVLLEPPTHGANISVWLIPPTVIALVLSALVLILRRMSIKSDLHEETIVASGVSGEQTRELIARVNVALGYEGIDSVSGNTGAGSESESEKSS